MAEPLTNEELDARIDAWKHGNGAAAAPLTTDGGFVDQLIAVHDALRASLAAAAAKIDLTDRTGDIADALATEILRLNELAGKVIWHATDSRLSKTGYTYEQVAPEIDAATSRCIEDSDMVRALRARVAELEARVEKLSTRCHGTVRIYAEMSVPRKLPECAEKGVPMTPLDPANAASRADWNEAAARLCGIERHARRANAPTVFYWWADAEGDSICSSEAPPDFLRGLRADGTCDEALVDGDLLWRVMRAICARMPLALNYQENDEGDGEWDAETWEEDGSNGASYHHGHPVAALAELAADNHLFDTPANAAGLLLEEAK